MGLDGVHCHGRPEEAARIRPSARPPLPDSPFNSVSPGACRTPVCPGWSSGALIYAVSVKVPGMYEYFVVPPHQQAAALHG
ncbi:hypothetical protein TOPH_06514, partial [Tolypocladium ophioglossoides CBS 100239]